MNLSAMFKSLCLPSKVYFVLAFVGILASVLAPTVFGGVSLFMHLIHLVYVVFWTWVLDLICKAGYKWLSWVLVLAPFLAAIFVVAFVLNDAFVQVQQGHASSTPIVLLSQ